MPNYAQNTITINGSTKQVKAVLEFLRCKKETNEDTVYIDFNNIVEMPSCLNISTNGYCNIAYLALYGELLSWLDPMIMDAKEKFDCWETEMQHIYKEMAKRCRENHLKTGHTSWYTWRMEHWGTKWNASCQEMLSENVIRFDTAWAPVIELFLLVSKKFPEVEFKYDYMVEMEYEAYSLTIKNGKIMKEEKFVYDFEE